MVPEEKRCEAEVLRKNIFLTPVKLIFCVWKIRI